MNFEREIEKKLIAKLNAYSYVMDNSIGVAHFGEIRGITDITAPVITTEVQQRVNINGPLWNVDIVLDVLAPAVSDVSGAKTDALYTVISDLIASIKKTPSQLSDATEDELYAVDGLTDNSPSARPEFAQIRLASLSARLFISWQHQS